MVSNVLCLNALMRRWLFVGISQHTKKNDPAGRKEGYPEDNKSRLPGISHKFLG